MYESIFAVFKVESNFSMANGMQNSANDLVDDRQLINPDDKSSLVIKTLFLAAWNEKKKKSETLRSFFLKFNTYSIEINRKITR